MKVKDLIEKLNKLPQNAEVGTFDVDNKYIFNGVQIFNNQDCVYFDNEYIKIEDIEKSRKSNEFKICDFYIG